MGRRDVLHPEHCPEDEMKKWIVSKRSDWVDGACTNRWIVHREGDLRGICECWEEGDAARIAGALNVGQASCLSN
jgi:hypothetical protein